MKITDVPASASGPWPAPAKLNLLLHITGRRADGYHELQTLFQFLTFGDWLYFDLRNDAEVQLSGEPAGVAAADDLTVQAAILLKESTGCSSGVSIYNDKRLPSGGGLGGGSSDAATTLAVLNKLWKLGLSLDELAGLGLRLGADVPVFIRGQAAWAEGVGEILSPVSLPEPWFLVVHPQVSVSTANIFSDPGLTRDTPRTKIPDPLTGVGNNDCEAVVRRKHPEVAAALDWLNAFAPARMTGTGACVFAAFESEAAANVIAGQVPARWSSFVARGVNLSPMRQALL
ncbi:MAG: 4-(cytidine 5'-diphospho)-2-C-methyl-D-erythritol kinase [Gammaproteobacteria bacterium]|jgi:4-diphosphocytidyl-2-C-methyl-D-erythritol kinase|nr:4-(cytidine 5'-diphospho)-2-C-methyl-D-erythritol kinase [Gammaproteobacteria bacterium]MDH3986287.1 4-(cytidine 5'-diphospho)-2-C-methyl-D-erythritol kinase [Gammaproteobacteria bacterium]